MKPFPAMKTETKIDRMNPEFQRAARGIVNAHVYMNVSSLIIELVTVLNTPQKREELHDPVGMSNLNLLEVKIDEEGKLHIDGVPWSHRQKTRPYDHGRDDYLPSPGSPVLGKGCGYHQATYSG